MPRANHTNPRLPRCPLAVGLGALALWAALCDRSWAQVPYEMVWQAPRSCPEAAAVRARVAALLGNAERPASEAPLRVRVRVQQRPSGYVAHLTLDSPEGQRARTLADRDCRVAAEAIAFIVASAVDPTLTRDPAADASDTAAPTTEVRADAETEELPDGVSETSRTTTREPRSAAPAATTTAAVAQPAPRSTAQATPVQTTSTRRRVHFTRARRHGLGFALSLEGIALQQPLPALSGGGLGRLWLHVGEHFQLGAGAGYVAPVRKSMPNDPATQVRFDRPFAAASLCGHTGTGAALAAGACASLQAGVNRADSSALTAGIDRTVPDVSLTLGLLVLRQLSKHLWLRSELASLWPLLRPRFEVNAGELVHQAEAVGFFASLGAEVSFD